jgi:GT2 family glycosyltransferase
MRLLQQLDEQPFQSIEVIVVEGDRRQGRAINTAAAIARGSLLITMDDDTRLGDPRVIEKLVAAFEADPTIGIAGVSNLIPDGAPPIVRRAMRELPRRSSAPVQSVMDSDMAEHPCLAIRRDVFRQVGGEHEVIPRGLDPYLRREVRRLGHRVVVIPDTWIHHLLPSSPRGILRQYFRNGVGAAYVRKFHREFVIEQAEQHGQDVGSNTSLGSHTVRYLGRMVRTVLSVRWIYPGTLITYATGYAWGLVTLREDSL